MNVANNEYVLSLGLSLGFGASATVAAGNVNWGSSGANAKQIRDAINHELTR